MGTVRRRRGQEPAGGRADELAAESEAILTGRYAGYLADRGLLVPPWAWVNVLAHAGEVELEAAASASVDRRPEDAGEWRRALAFMAEDVLRHTRSTGVALAEVQQSTLVPLELELMGSTEGRQLRPGQLAGLVLAAVHRHPSRRPPT